MGCIYLVTARRGQCHPSRGEGLPAMHNVKLCSPRTRTGELHRFLLRSSSKLMSWREGSTSTSTAQHGAILECESCAELLPTLLTRSHKIATSSVTRFRGWKQIPLALWRWSIAAGKSHAPFRARRSLARNSTLKDDGSVDSDDA